MGTRFTAVATVAVEGGAAPLGGTDAEGGGGGGGAKGIAEKENLSAIGVVCSGGWGLGVREREGLVDDGMVAEEDGNAGIDNRGGVTRFEVAACLNLASFFRETTWNQLSIERAS